MMNFKLNSTYLPLLFIFVLVNVLCVIFDDIMDAHGINHLVVQGANLLLFLLMFVSAYLHFKALRNSNPHAFLRSVMGATVIKMFAIAGVAFIYLFAAGEQRSVYAVLVGMGLYIVYTVVELRGLFKMNKQQNNVKS